jgi:hypothetical protein
MQSESFYDTLVVELDRGEAQTTERLLRKLLLSAAPLNPQERSAARTLHSQIKTRICEIHQNLTRNREGN